jgi:hypothetical protein
MKPLLLAFLVMSSTGSMLGQGTIYFYNYVPSAGLNAPVLDTDGKGVTGFQFRAQLLAGSSPSTVSPIGAPADFSIPTPGYWGSSSGDSLTRIVPNVPAGGAAYAQVLVWSTLRGDSYELAAANGGKHGASDVFSVLTGGETQGGTLPPTFPGYMTGLQSFSLTGVDPAVPEPSTLALAALGGVAIASIMGRQRRGV